MPYNPKGFNDLGGDATMAPSELQPPFNYADGGAVGWAGDTTVYNTQSQIGNMLATPGGFSGMSKQFTEPSPMAMAEGGSVNSLVSRLSHEFSKRGLDLNKFMARRLAQQGQSGDTMLAHINPEEAAMLKEAGGSGTVNPDTGLQEFYRSGGDSAWGGSSRSDSTSARAGDTPGFGSGGGGSVGGGGGYGSTSSGISGGGGGGSDRSSGGGGRESPVYTSPTSNQTASILNAQRAAQEAADQAAAANAARIAAERASYQTPSTPVTTPAPEAPEAPAAPISLSNILNQLIGITPAEAGQNVSRQGWENYYTKGITPQPPINYAATEPQPSVSQDSSLFSGLQTLATDPFAGKFVSATGGVYPGPAPQLQTGTFKGENILPSGTFTDRGMSMPSLRDAAEMARLQAAEAAQPKPDTFYSDLQRVNDKLAAIRGMDREPAPSVSPNEAYGGTPQEFEGQPSPFSAFDRAVVQGTRSPFEAIVKSVTEPAPVAKPAPISNAAAASILGAARQAPPSSVFSQPSPNENIYTYTPPLTAKPVEQPVASTATTTSAKPAPVTEEVAAPVKAAPVFTAAAKKTAAAPAVTTPATQATDQGILSKIMADINNANAKRIAELEKAGEFAGGSKADVAAALKVDPSQLQSRIVNYDGRQKVDYFTKGLDQVLGEIVSGPFKAIGNLFGGGNYDLKNGYSITPSGDVIPNPVYTPPTGGGGGGGGMAQAPAPVQAAAVTPAVTTPVSPALPQAFASFKRKYVPLTNYAQYGYGPESALYEYTAAEGGPVGPLSQKRK